MKEIRALGLNIEIELIMERNLTKSFDNQNIIQENNFDSIKITLASPEKIKSWSYGEIKKQKQSIIELLDQKKMVSSAQEFLVQLKITNVYAVNIKE